MDKIGIIVSRVSSGAEILFSSEAAKQWQNEALDTRNYLKCIDIEKISEDKFDSTFFDFVTFGKDVAFICTNKYISGRDSDLISAMIVVPGFVDINGKELADILRTTKEILQETKRDDQKLEQICSIDYGPKQVQNHSVPSIEPNSEGQYAYRYYGSGTPFSLSEILGSIFQNYYCNYKAVLLIDAESGISPKDGLKDLTESDFKNSCILEYPKSVPSDITMKVNGKLFTQSLLFDEGQQITLDISKKGCWPIKENIILDQPVKTISLANLEWDVKVDLTWFQVCDKAAPNAKIPSSSVKITINDKEVDRDGYNRFNIHELTSAIIVVDVTGFEEARFKLVNLLKVKRPITLPLKKQPKIYKYLIFDGCKVPNEAIAFSFEATHYNEKKSPLAGYKIDRFSNSNKAYILVKKGYGWKKLTIGLVVFLFACIGIISSCVWLYHGMFPKEISKCERCGKEYQGESCPNCETYSQCPTCGKDMINGECSECNKAMSEDEIKYLKQNTTCWNRDDMQNISSKLAELFDDINKRKFSKIIDYWNPKIQNLNISYWPEIVNIARTGFKNNEEYNQPGDNKINISNYINSCSENPVNSESTQSGSSSANGSHTSSGSSSASGSHTQSGSTPSSSSHTQSGSSSASGGIEGLHGE